MIEKLHHTKIKIMGNYYLMNISILFIIHLNEKVVILDILTIV